VLPGLACLLLFALFVAVVRASKRGG